MALMAANPLARKVDRRTLLAGSAMGVALPVVAGSTGPRWGTSLVRRRTRQEFGAQSGDVTTDSAVLWGRAQQPGRMHVQLRSGRRNVERAGPVVTPTTDLTAKLEWRGLAPGREYDARVWFSDDDGVAGEPVDLSFATAPIHPTATSFVWSGDTCGQGWGINPELGGLVGYRAMLDVEPDLFLHCGDTIYADMPISETQRENTGHVWRNVVTPEVSKVAESLDEFRGHYRYNLLDAHLREFNSRVPMVAQWDDHETADNWWPGRILDDDRYTERRVDVLAARSRQAWQEYLPVSDRMVGSSGRDGFTGGIYRKISRGAHLDVFCLDMRSSRDPNQRPGGKQKQALLGADQAAWLVREAAASRATWKVISVDLPIGIVCTSHVAPELDSVSNGAPGAPGAREVEFAEVLSGLKRAGVRNVVLVTADVHYAAAHHYSPERASGFHDFDPFWEFVAGPIAGSTFEPKELDPTFGPEVHFTQGAAGESESPRTGNQYFGHVTIDTAGAMTVRLRNIRGQVLWSRTLEPEA